MGSLHPCSCPEVFEKNNGISTLFSNHKKNEMKHMIFFPFLNFNNLKLYHVFFYTQPKLKIKHIRGLAQKIEGIQSNKFKKGLMLNISFHTKHKGEKE
jgi:hypothetical protein